MLIIVIVIGVGKEVCRGIVCIISWLVLLSVAVLLVLVVGEVWLRERVVDWVSEDEVEGESEEGEEESEGVCW